MRNEETSDKPEAPARAELSIPHSALRIPHSKHLGRRVFVHESVPSTNDLAASLVSDPANDGAIVLTKSQSAGRGQYGRTWQSPPGSSILMSALLFPPPHLRRPALLTAWAAVAVGETILQATGLQAKIKWPNDVLLRGRKVCGILIEQGRGTVIGIGLNVNQSAEDFEAMGLPDAASLAVFTKGGFDVEELARLLIRTLDEEYDRLVRGDSTTLEACWKWRMGLLGKQVAAECMDGSEVRGRLREMAFAGLELEQPDGSLRVLKPEEVRHVWEA